MSASLRGYWRQAAPYQRFLYWLAVLFLANAAVHGAAFLLGDLPWEGPVSWRKPLLFSFSFAAASASMAWVMTFLPRNRALGWSLAVVFAVASVGETALISMQVWRGTASHFNVVTSFDEAVFSAMGFLIIGVAVVFVVLMVWSFVSLRAPTSLAWAIRLGLILLVAGQAIGGIVLGEGLRQLEVGPVASPVAFGEAGSMNVPHALALHGLQVVPVLGWLGASVAHAEAGRAPFQLTGATGVVMLIAVLVVAAAYVVAIAGLNVRARAEPQAVGG
jgi:hypothetical protein